MKQYIVVILMAKKKAVPYFKARVQKRINNLSRAINKIDPNLQKSVLGMGVVIKDIKAGINDISYIKNGREVKVRYDAISSLSQGEQSSLVKSLSVDRYNLRQERALSQLKEKGKISWQFKRSLEKDNPLLLQSIQEFEKKFEGSSKEAIASEFGQQEIQTGEDWFGEADNFFQGKDGSPALFDFYRPGEAGGYTELNVFTWNIFKIERGL